MHTKQAIEATKSFKSTGKCDYDLKSNENSNLVSCNFFTTNIFEVKGLRQINYGNLDSFVIYMCVEGETKVAVDGHTETLKMGESVLVPATMRTALFNGKNAKLLEVYIKPQQSQSKKLAI